MYIILFLIKNIQAWHRQCDVRPFCRSKAQFLSCVPLASRRPAPSSETGNSGPESPGRSEWSPYCSVHSGTLTPSRDYLWLDCCGTVWLVCFLWASLQGLTFSRVVCWPTLRRDRKWDQQSWALYLTEHNWWVNYSVENIFTQKFQELWQNRQVTLKWTEHFKAERLKQYFFTV